ncbi:MAG: BON domain-containing protein [Steroidobacteraceae bacterium]
MASQRDRCAYRHAAAERPYFGTQALRWEEQADDPYRHYAHRALARGLRGGPYPHGKTYRGGFYTGGEPDEPPLSGQRPQGVNHRGRGPKNYRRSDERIGEEIVACLAGDDSIDARNVELHIKNGLVTLQGSVPERRIKHAIEDLVADCIGVTDVENRIRVDLRRAEM